MKKTIIGIAIMTVAVLGTLCWEIFGREELIYKDALVLNRDVEAYTTISEDMLASRKILKPMQDAYLADDFEEIVGKETTQYIATGQELFPRFFKDRSLMVTRAAKEYVFAISVNDILAYPKSLTKGDNVYIYANNELVFQSTVLAVKDASGNEIYQNNNRTESTGQISSIEIKCDDSHILMLSELIAKSLPITLVYN